MSARLKASRVLFAAAAKYPAIRPELEAIVPPEDVQAPYQALYERVLQGTEAVLLDEFALHLEEKEFKAVLDAYDGEPIPTAGHALGFARSYARWLRETRVKHEAMTALKDWSPQAGLPLAEVLTDLALRAASPEHSAFNLRSEIEGLRTEVLDAIDNGGTVSVSCGIPAIDARLRGMREGALWVIGGRASHGKTQLGLSIAHHLLTHEQPVLYVTLEMGTREVLGRLLAIEGELSVGSLLAGEYTREEEISRFARTTERGMDWPLTVYDNLRSVRRIRQYVHRHQPRVWFVDWLGLMSTPGTSRAQALSEAVYALKGLAVETRTTGVIIHQLNREIEHRGQSWEPKLSDMKDSGGVEEAADAVLSIVRSAYVTSDAPVNAARLFLLKNRLTGQIGKLNVTCQHGRFLQDFHQPERERVTR